MIIDVRDDKVTLSGALDRNLWSSIHAAAYMLLRQHHSGILIDASEITSCTPDGARTFLDAAEYIERHRARIMLCEVPDAVMEVVRSVPGVRSHVPIAHTCAEARRSLELALHERDADPRFNKAAAITQARELNDTIFAPFAPGAERIGEMIALAKALAFRPAAKAERRPRAEWFAPIHVACLIVAPRTVPLNAAMAEEEEAARQQLSEVKKAADALQIPIVSSIARTRDLPEEIVGTASRLNAERILLAIPPTNPDDPDARRNLVRNVLAKAPCEVVLRG